MEFRVLFSALSIYCIFCQDNLSELLQPPQLSFNYKVGEPSLKCISSVPISFLEKIALKVNNSFKWWVNELF